jgi:hypothetical protein
MIRDSTSARTSLSPAGVTSSTESSASTRFRCFGANGSDEWLENYDEPVMELIEAYHTVVLPASGDRGSTDRP